MFRTSPARLTGLRPAWPSSTIRRLNAGGSVAAAPTTPHRARFQGCRAFPDVIDPSKGACYLCCDTIHIVHPITACMRSPSGIRRGKPPSAPSPSSANGTLPMPNTHRTPDRTIERLSYYRRLLEAELEAGRKNIFSHQLASLAGVTPAQIRRDLTYVGYAGSPQVGYGVRALRDAVGRALSPHGQVNVGLVGVGYLGRALLAYFSGRHEGLVIRAAFDVDPAKTGRVLRGCRCYPMEDLREVVRREAISMAIISVPAAAAQRVAEALVGAGVKGILNFAPATLRVGGDVYVETMDLTMAIEKVAHFAQARQQPSEVPS